MTTKVDSLDEYLSGDALFGDDFSQEQIEAWYRDEAEAYADLGARDRARYQYLYHAWNRQNAYAYLPPGELRHVLGFGSAYGDELLPVLGRTRRVTIVDPSDAFATGEVHGTPATFVKPAIDGRLPFADGQFDLTTCFGVLHHIPNVSTVVQELARTLVPGGHLLIREPIVSMGDWRHARPGLTPHERGIPLPVLLRIVDAAGLETVRRTLVDFPVVRRLCQRLRVEAYNSDRVVRIDRLLSAVFAWNRTYHPRTPLQKLRPGSVFLVLRKPTSRDARG